MKVINKAKILLPLFSFINAISMSHTLAQDNTTPTHNDRVEDFAGQAGLSSALPTTVIENTIGIALSFLAMICFILIMYSGFVWMTSAGNEEKVKKAKSILKNAIIGAIIVLFSFIITKAVFFFVEEVNWKADHS